MTPILDNVFVRHEPAKYHGTIAFLPTEINASDVLRMRVVAVGPGKPNRKGVVVKPEVAPGDLVLWQAYTHGPVEIAKNLYSVKAGDLIAVIEAAP